MTNVFFKIGYIERTNFIAHKYTQILIVLENVTTKEPVKKNQCKNGLSCKFLWAPAYNWNAEKEMSEINKLKKIIEAKRKDIDEILILYSRDITDCKSRSYLMETEIEGDLE